MTYQADGRHMTRYTERHASIDSPGTRRLAAEIRILRRRARGLDVTVTNIRSGDNDMLRALIASAQHGDTVAATTAIWALLPRLTAVVMSRLPTPLWREAMDDYLALTYLTLLDVDVTASPTFLADKLVARARRRYERAEHRVPDEHRDTDALSRQEASQPSVEDEALARIAWRDLAEAVQGGAVSREAWSTLVRVRFQLAPGQATDRERQAAHRAIRNLSAWMCVAA